MLNVNGHAQSIGYLSVAMDVLFNVHSGQCRDIQAHIAPPRTCWFCVSVVLCQAQNSRAYLVLPTCGAMNQQISANGYFYVGQNQFCLGGWCRVKIKGTEPVCHPLNGVQDLNRIARVILAEDRNARVNCPLLEHFFGSGEWSKPPIRIREIRADRPSNVPVTNNWWNLRILGASDDAKSRRVGRQHEQREFIYRNARGRPCNRRTRHG